MTVKINANEHVFPFYDILMCIKSVATKKMNIGTMKVKLTNFLYLTIAHAFVFVRNIININTYNIILICVFLILSFSVECVSIYVVLLICHNGEYRITCKLF
jgi:hypothetical protein